MSARRARTAWCWRRPRAQVLSHRRQPRGWRWVLKASAAGGPRQSGKGITAVHARPLVIARQAGGYTLVESVQITLSAASQAFAFLSCSQEEQRRCRTVPLKWRRGDRSSRNDLAVNINSSYPYFTTGRAGLVDANNGSSSATLFNVYVVCV